MVAVAVIERLEEINVNHQQRELLLLALGAFDLKLELLLKVAAGLQAGKKIGEGKADKSFIAVLAGKLVLGHQRQYPQELRVGAVEGVFFFGKKLHGPGHA